jgi:hypothetical protein
VSGEPAEVRRRDATRIVAGRLVSETDWATWRAAG